MPNAIVKQITVPVEVSGVIQNVTYDIADAEARQRISELGKALYWVGVTTDALTDGATTNPITVGGQSVTVQAGAVAQYNTEEYAFDGTNWQKLGEGNLGALAYKNDVEANYTPQGNINIVKGADVTDSVPNVTGVGTLPTFTYDSANEALTFSAGTLPTLGTAKTVVTATGSVNGEFEGTEAIITAS